MSKKKLIYILITSVVLVLVLVLFILLKFDNTTDKVVNENKTKIVMLVDNDCINNNVKATLSIENNNGFDINLLNVGCDNSNIHLDINNEGAFVIKKDDIFNYDFTITFNQEIENGDYLSVLKNSKILLSFNASAANQNDVVTIVEPVIIKRNSTEWR